MLKEIPTVFGSTFAPEMPIATYHEGSWSDINFQPSDRLTLHPAAHCLHYASEIFEGMKAFRHEDNSVHIFRLDDGVERLRKSAQSLYLPMPESELLREMIIQAVSKAKDYVPDQRGALYIRPALIGITPNIGSATHPTDDALLYILTSPVGDYLKQGAALRVLVETEHQRCAPHMGSIKAGGNYASALHWTMEAEKKYHAQQVLFCPNGDVQETGASNFFLIDGKTLITKPLTTEFLHGITRRTVIQVAQENGYKVEEREFRVEEIAEKVSNGAEAILTGTAAVISPITNFIINGEDISVKSNIEGLAIRKLITDIQYGRSEDKHHWLTAV
ncbi:branched-chain-amino-acid transaminase [Suttonella ornithocola]|uniref:Branched-chain-amino-acid aminotransferase n=1 Tax=Suttonella ornithocola TaxID=279832 RepID=A0A380MZH9_9GAMM|nr:branched-chain-amino-acid transaminase [Suttonella ornithocola]SUO97283.1 Branched-chain-amino-acid aminotransferase 2 [Suttonella ornithocola]